MLVSKRPKAERDRIVNCVTVLCEAVGRTATKATMLAYLVGTDGLSVEAIERATEMALRRPDKWMPSPGELAQLAGETSHSDRAVLAFQVLKTHCSRVGSFRSVDFDDPLINATVRNLGGWTRACEMPESEFDTWYRKDFCQVYEMFCRTGASPEMVQHLVGESEKSNRAHKFLEAAERDVVKVATGLPWAGEPVNLLGGDAAKSALALEGPK